MDDKKPEPAPEAPQLQIEVPPAMETGIYTNLAFISHTDTELVLDFVFAQPGNPKMKVLARVVTSPIHAKRMLAALADNLSKYEARFGAIKVAESSGYPEGTLN